MSYNESHLCIYIIYELFTVTSHIKNPVHNYIHNVSRFSIL